MLKELRKEIKNQADREKAIILQRFFKTWKWQYWEGDIFLGIVVPKQRKIAKKYIDLDLDDLQELIKSEIHEERLICLFILVEKFKLFSENKKAIFDFYIKNAKQINNWDLVDLSAPKIIGEYLLTKNRKILYKLAKSDNLWERRISIMATFTFLKNWEYDDTFEISKILLLDRHNLIQKATWWMLREIGNRNLKAEEDFLKIYYKKMPRTMLRYAIEKFDETKRKFYMSKEN